jgi:hypothetical protein
VPVQTVNTAEEGDKRSLDQATGIATCTAGVRDAAAAAIVTFRGVALKPRTASPELRLRTGLP